MRFIPYSRILVERLGLSEVAFCLREITDVIGALVAPTSDGLSKAVPCVAAHLGDCSGESVPAVSRSEPLQVCCGPFRLSRRAATRQPRPFDASPGLMRPDHNSHFFERAFVQK